MRKSQNGILLIELAKNTVSTAKLVAAVAKALGSEAEVRRLCPKVDVLVRDIDEEATIEEVRQAVSDATGVASLEEGEGDMVVKSLGKGYAGVQRAIVTVPEKLARNLENRVHIKIGWVSFRVRVQPTVIRCFRCHRIGHVAAKSSKVDEGIIFRRCGAHGHIAGVCTNPPKCLACVEKGLPGDRVTHMTATRRCPLLRAQIQRR